MNMKYRRSARERAVQFLYGLEFTGNDWREALPLYWQSSPARPNVKEYAEALIAGYFKHSADLDAEIDGALENWAADRVGKIERGVLRVALYEMRHGDVPRAVAINEAIEVARRYGSDESPGFVNGVLDRIGKD